MSPAPTARNVLGLLGAFVVASMVAGVLAAGLFLPAVGASGVSASKSVDFFNNLPGTLKTPPLAERSRVLASDGTEIARFFDENRVNVPLSKISKPMQQAVIAIEDARFYHHGGIDPQGLARAFVVNQVHGGTVQGASTLTQQYVKNVLVETAFAKGDKAGIAAARADTNARKVKEIRYAVGLEKTMTKDEILNRYLNIIWLGGQTYGVEAAGRYYFNTHAKDLTVPQAALLAGMVQSPVDWSPTAHPEAALSRRNTVLKRMSELGLITPADYEKYKATKLGVHLTDLNNGCANASLAYGFYCDYVKNLIIKSDEFKALGSTEAKRANALTRGGLTIQTNLSLKIQKAATKAVNKVVPASKSPGVGTAAVTVQPGTGKVLAIAQNRKYDPSDKPGHTATNWAVDYKYGGSAGFQTGSTFKPFTLATWLKQGKSLNATVSSAVGTAPFSAFHTCLPGGMDKIQTYTYYNSEGGSQGNMSVFKATYASVNGAYVSMEKQLNLCDIANTAESFGMHSAAPRRDDCSLKHEQTTAMFRCFPALTLGIMDISPMTMAAAYAGFANQGSYCTPVAISSIKNLSGEKVDVPKTVCKQVMDKKVANTLNYGLSHVFKPGGTAASVGGLPGGREASGKTGTTNGSAQTWFCGYTTKLATAVWVGLPNSPTDATLNNRKINGVVRRVFGATYAAPIWKQIMTKAVEGTPKEKFAGPDQELIKSPMAKVPNVDGQSVDAAKATLKNAGFDPVVGGAVDSQLAKGTVASTSPAGGSSASAGSTVTINVSNGKGGGGKPGKGGNGDLLGGLFPIRPNP